MINLFDLEEDHDPNLTYIDGSNLDGASWEQDEIILHNQNMLEAIGEEQMILLNEAFPEEYSIRKLSEPTPTGASGHHDPSTYRRGMPGYVNPEKYLLGEVS